MYRKKGLINKVVKAVLLIVLLFAIFEIAGIGGSKTPIDIKVLEGEGLSAIADRLDKAGVINSEFTFKIYARLTGKHIYQKGMHNFNTSMSYGQIIKELEKMPDAEVQTVIIP